MDDDQSGNDRLAVVFKESWDQSIATPRLRVDGSRGEVVCLD